MVTLMLMVHDIRHLSVIGGDLRMVIWTRVFSMLQCLTARIERVEVGLEGMSLDYGSLMHVMLCWTFLCSAVYLDSGVSMYCRSVSHGQGQHDCMSDGHGCFAILHAGPPCWQHCITALSTPRLCLPEPPPTGRP